MISPCYAILLAGTLWTASPPEPALRQKLLIGGHGHAMVDTRSLREHLKTIERAPFDGVILNVNPNWQHQDARLQRHRNWTWGGRPARGPDNYTHAIDDLVDIASRAQRLKHNFMLYTMRTAKDFDPRAENIDWRDPEWHVVANNAYVAGVICQQGSLDGIWFDLETADGGPFNWIRSRKTVAGYQEYCRMVRQRGREWMAAAYRAKPDIVVMVSHGYGDIHAFGGDADSLSDSPYGLMPAFLDGLLEGCTPQATLVHGGEATYSHMTYAAFKHYLDVQRIRTRRLCGVPDLARRHLRYATAVWPDFRSDRDGFDLADYSRNHFTPTKLQYALHNALAASDRYAWTWNMQVHWWPVVNHVERLPSPPEFRRVFPPAYLRAVAAARQPLDLDWNPGLVAPRSYPTPTIDNRRLEPLLQQYDRLAELTDGWQFALDPDDTDHWGIEFTEYETFPGRWTDISLGDWWENQGWSYDGLAWYRHRFRVPPAARDKRIYAVIAGVQNSAKVFATQPGRRGRQVGKIVNGQPAVLDITDVINPARPNVLSVRLRNQEGPGGLLGPVWIVAGKQTAGKHAYLALAGTPSKTWGHWVKSPRFEDTRHFQLGDEFTVAARLRAPAQGSYHARVWASGTSISWELVLRPDGVSLGGETIPLDVSQWHEYGVVVRRQGKQVEQQLFIDGSPRLRRLQAHTHRAAGDSQIGFGSPWITLDQAPTAPRTRLEVDYLRYANRVIVPATRRPVLEAAPRPEDYWDITYDGDVLPHRVGWKYWPEGDPTTMSRIVVPDPYLVAPREMALIPESAKVEVAHWSSGFVPRDLPRLAGSEVQAGLQIRPEGALLTIPHTNRGTYAWPGATLTRLRVTNWAAYQSLALTIANPADHPVEIALKAIDQERDYWYRYFTIPAQQTIGIRIPITALAEKMDPSQMFAIGVNRRNVNQPQEYLFSNFSLVR